MIKGKETPPKGGDLTGKGDFKHKKSGELKECAKCSLNGSVKKYKFICKGNVPKYLCHVCLKCFDSGASALEFLNLKSDFSRNKKGQFREARVNG